MGGVTVEGLLNWLDYTVGTPQHWGLIPPVEDGQGEKYEPLEVRRQLATASMVLATLHARLAHKVNRTGLSHEDRYSIKKLTDCQKSYNARCREWDAQNKVK